MPHHPALTSGRVAVITGAASGIGLATALKVAKLGMKVCLADIDEVALVKAADLVGKATGEKEKLITVTTDVSKIEDIEQLRDSVYSAFGEVAFLMNNAGTEGGGQLSGERERWQKIINVNLWGVVNGIQTFLPLMKEQGTDCAIVNTGSKQGITCPPGDTAYNISKAGIKVVTEALAHDLRGNEGCRVSAHLLIPGFTFTGLTKPNTDVKPEAAWMPEQVVDFMLEAMSKGDFYILCPDNSVSRKLDALRIEWAAGDIIENRPPLSRWHKDYQHKFSEFVKKSLL